MFFLWPIFNVLRLSLTDTTLLREDYAYTLRTFEQTLTDPALPKVLGVTAIFVGASVAGQLLLGLAIALIVQRAVARNLHGAVLVRSVVLTAWVMPGVLIGVVWQVVLNEAPYGLVNAFLNALGLAPVAWLSDTKLAVVSVVTANIWRGTAFTMLLLYAALHTVNRELYDAARVDGASRLRSLWHVTLPQIRPVLLVNVILITIATLNTFDMILSLTGGGPGAGHRGARAAQLQRRVPGLQPGQRLRVRRAPAAREPAADRRLPPPARPGGAMSAHDGAAGAP